MRYIKIINESEFLDGFGDSVRDYIETHAEVDHVWYDISRQETFGYSNKRERENPSPGSFNMSGWYNFHLTAPDWLIGAPQLFESLFRNEKRYGDVHIDEEVLYTTDNSLNKFKDSRVLVVGGGTTSKLHADELEKVGESYDYLMTCNHFYLNERLNQTKFDLIFLGEEVNLADPKLDAYLRKYKPMVGFEHGSPEKITFINKLAKLHPDIEIFIYMTRYFSRLGYTSRQIVLAGLLGAKEVSFMGLDGWPFEDGTAEMHAFEKKKLTSKPHYYVHHKWDHLGLIMWDYMLNSNRLKNTTFRNLAKPGGPCQLAGFKEFVTRGYTD